MSPTSQAPQSPVKKRVPHHENLYIQVEIFSLLCCSHHHAMLFYQCKQLLIEELLPVTIEQAVYLAALQLHIEVLFEETVDSQGIVGIHDLVHNQLPVL